STVNQQVAFTATVTPTFTGTAVPKGTVTFTNTSTATVLCTQTVASNGTVPVCNFTFASAPAAGFNNVVAAFTSSDSNFVSSASATYKQTVGPTATTTTVAAVPSTSVVNQMVIFTATITPSFTGPTNPTGTVAFTYSLNGGS